MIKKLVLTVATAGLLLTANTSFAGSAVTFNGVEGQWAVCDTLPLDQQVNPYGYYCFLPIAKTSGGGSKSTSTSTDTSTSSQKRKGR